MTLKLTIWLSLDRSNYLAVHRLPSQSYEVPEEKYRHHYLKVNRYIPSRGVSEYVKDEKAPRSV